MDLEVSKRIDKGIKRGPRNAHKPARYTRRPDLGSWAIPKDLNAKEVLEQFLTETTTSHIAQKYGISRKALVSWLREVEPKAWKEAQVLRALCRKEDADDNMESACDAFSLARAREMLRSGQWDLERLDSANYGQKTQIEVKDQPLNAVEQGLLASAQELLAIFKEKVIEAEVIAPAQIEEKP